ncbi:MAG: hypothetical protein IAE86_10315 [Burkholderiaceae bacterium]|nr:hypothetical protein [Burkholderiaceae bacterium]
MVRFGRSGYHRAGVERTMRSCPGRDVEEFFRPAPRFQRIRVRSGVQLIKYRFSITDDEQHLRFLGRIHDPLEQWKLSPMDLESRRRWEAYTTAKEEMLSRTHIAAAPWWVVQAVDKKKARLNCISHLLTRFDCAEIERPTIELPARARNVDYIRHPVPQAMIVPERYRPSAARASSPTTRPTMSPPARAGSCAMR